MLFDIDPLQIRYPCHGFDSAFHNTYVTFVNFSVVEVVAELLQLV